MTNLEILNYFKLDKKYEFILEQNKNLKDEILDYIEHLKLDSSDIGNILYLADIRQSIETDLKSFLIFSYITLQEFHTIVNKMGL
ncbi:hypothetical protein [Mycoplasma seminis]|uniref:Uncharacterized protein n=1 Tax=Mycoplasma seminis TaxID=512749 RepID=A0ABY9HAM0_9MOLU|nr:hypothetical protein [Mycoplasma seminis]WLP85306.1 hypothetical protein Q8852_03210 [Mycoplasma seminis]